MSVDEPLRFVKERKMGRNWSPYEDRTAVPAGAVATVDDKAHERLSTVKCRRR